MLKRNVSKLIISGLVIILIIVSVKYVCLLKNYNSQHNTADAYLYTALSTASSDFEAISAHDINNKYNCNYNDAMSKLASSSLIFQFTTYSKSNNYLLFVLANLCDTMQNYSYKSSIIKNSQAIHSCLYKLSINPKNKHVTYNLSKLISKISPKK